ncbi:hypothetical protein Hanom_Chr11g01030511 [Helianthus anomalus]
MKAFEDDEVTEEQKVSEEKTSKKKKEKKKDTEVKTSGKKQDVSYNKCPPPLENGYLPRKSKF